jgi:hypothetical protein
MNSTWLLKGSCQTKDKQTDAEWRALWLVNANELINVLLADKGNAAVVLGSSDYNQKIIVLLEDKAYKKPKKHSTDSVEHNTVRQ